MGYRRGLLNATSGLVLTAFQPADLRKALLDRLTGRMTGPERRMLHARIVAIETDGAAREPSANVQGITDLSVPVRGREGVIAALTIPYVHQTPARYSEVQAIELLLEAAAEIARESC